MGKATLRVLRGMGSAVFELELASLPPSWLQPQHGGRTRVLPTVAITAENSAHHTSSSHLPLVKGAPVHHTARVVVGPSAKDGVKGGWIKLPRVVTKPTVFAPHSLLYAEDTVTVAKGGACAGAGGSVVGVLLRVIDAIVW